jgi:hypothetical protein
MHKSKSLREQCSALHVKDYPKKEKTMSGILLAPHSFSAEIQINILQYLDFKNLCNLRQSCKAEKDVVDLCLPILLKDSAKDIKRLIEKEITTLQAKYTTYCKTREESSEGNSSYEFVHLVFNHVMKNMLLKYYPNLTIFEVNTADVLHETLKLDPKKANLEKQRLVSGWHQDKFGFIDIEKNENQKYGANIAKLTNLKIMQTQMENVLNQLNS